MPDIQTPSSIENVKVSELLPYANNARLHSRANVRKIARSILEYGWTQPVLITADKEIIAGHGRVLAAEYLGMEYVPCIYLANLTEEQAQAYRLADNRLSLDSEWDEELLAVELQTLANDEYDVSTIGFSVGELVSYIDTLGDEDSGFVGVELGVSPSIKAAIYAADIDDELGDTDMEESEGSDELDNATIPVAKKGQVWQLGRHRVVCGDCTDQATVEMLLEGARPEILLTDPPYCSGGFQESGRNAGSVGKTKRDHDNIHVVNDKLSTKGYMNLIKNMLEQFTVIHCYIFTDFRMWNVLFDIIESKGFAMRSMIVWDKKSPGVGNGWRSQSELVMYATNGKPKWDPHKGYGNVIQHSRTKNELHPTQKPVGLLKMILDNTDFAEGVYDPFMGSGSTLLASEEMVQTFYGCELEPRYIDTTIRRWREHTGQDAVLVAGENTPGRTFSEIESEFAESRVMQDG